MTIKSSRYILIEDEEGYYSDSLSALDEMLSNDRINDMKEAFITIRGIVLGGTPDGQKRTKNERLCGINEIVGFAVFGDFKDSEWVEWMERGAP